MAIKNASKGNGAVSSHIETHVNIPLSDIYVDLRWNSRSDLGEAEGGPDEHTGLKGLKDSIASTGQDTPIVVRPRAAHEKFRQPYFLVAGFRRYKAITDIAHETKNATPTIKAFIRNLNELDARNLNLRENIARENLSGPDLAFGVSKLHSAGEAMGGAPTQTTLAMSLNISQAYVGKLLAIAAIKATTKGPNGKNMPILDHWRETPSTNRPTVDAMYSKVAKAKTAEDQTEAYETLLAGKTKKDGRDPKVRLENMAKQAAKVGKMIGLLVYEDAITLNDEAVFFDEYLDRFMSIPEDTKAHDKRKLVASAEESYTFASENGDAKPAGEDEDATEDAPKAPGKAPKGKGKGKASATAN